MNLALEVNRVDEVAARIRGILDVQIAAGYFRQNENAAEARRTRLIFPEVREDRPVQGSHSQGRNFSLFDFPILKCWPQDAGRFITWPLVITANPETGKRNVGVYRMQVYRRAHHRHALANAKARRGTFPPRARTNPDGRIEVAVAIGADPATCLSGILPIPPDLDEFMFAGFLRREPVEMVQCETSDTGSSRQRGNCAGRLRQFK